MTSYLTKFVLGRIFQESSSNKEGREDPYYEYPASELNKAGKRKSKRRKKALPPGLTDEEGEILTKVKRRAYRLDMSFGSFLGVRFGWGSVIGIVPGIGDALDALLSLMVVKTAMRVGLPFGILLHMLLNVALDFVIGLVPFVGDLIDAGYKCSTRNAVLLEKHLRKVGQERLKAQGVTDVPDDSLPTGEDSGEDIDLEAQASSSRHGGNNDRRDRDRERERDRDRDHRDRSRHEESRSDGRGPRRSDRRDDRRDDHRDDHRDNRRDDRRDGRRNDHHARDDRDRREPTHSRSKRKDNGRRDDRDSRR
ncbi:hypothetical protein TWF106_009928 [Orbilia oligospora]|uniref:DUF4112 domain-containing protein n=1 Tax=Orbilia oligospora TaxID=2813651 RepID=A0A7C8UU45_ORBOL|nr:hypothetical protein TWF106_009928 [Orbilia oligospora]